MGQIKLPKWARFSCQTHLVLFDDEKNARSTKAELVQEKLIRGDNVVFVTEGFLAAGKPSEADVEDLVDPVVYNSLVLDSYANELAGKTLALNANVPRIEKRYELAFRDLGLEFHKTRPARLFVNKSATQPGTVMTPTTLDNFGRLFTRISELHAKNIGRQDEPFR